MLVLAVCSLKGGVGKTSVTLGLASGAHARGLRTLVVDLDPQGDVTTGLAVAEEPSTTLADVLEDPRAKVVRSAVVPSGWSWRGADGAQVPLDVLTGGPALAARERPDASEKALLALSRALAKAEGYELVLLDCPPHLGALTRSGLAASDRALVVAEPGLFAVNAADRALGAVHGVRGSLNPRLQPLGVVVNRFRSSLAEHRYRVEELQSMFGPLVLSPVLPERSVLQRAQGATVPIHEYPGGRDLARAFDAILDRALRAPHGR